jgi:hypothetical protein
MHKKPLSSFYRALPWKSLMQVWEQEEVTFFKGFGANLALKQKGPVYLAPISSYFK